MIFGVVYKGSTYSRLSFINLQNPAFHTREQLKWDQTEVPMKDIYTLREAFYLPRRKGGLIPVPGTQRKCTEEPALPTRTHTKSIFLPLQEREWTAALTSWSVIRA